MHRHRAKVKRMKRTKKKTGRDCPCCGKRGTLNQSHPLQCWNEKCRVVCFVNKRAVK